MQRRKTVAARLVPAREPLRDAQVARPPEGARLGKIGERREMFFAELEQFLHRIGRCRCGELLGVVADGAMDDGAAVARAGRRVDRVERLQAENMARVNRIGIAQPVLDGGDRQAQRPCREFRFRRRALGRFHLGRMIERAGELEISVAARERAVPARAGERGDALHEARGHGRAAGDLGGAAEDDFRGAQALGEIVRGKADAALWRIETEIAAHRAAQPGIVARLGRPGALVEAAQHHPVDGLQARFQRPVDMHAHVVDFRAAHHAVGDCGVEQFGIVGFGDGKPSGGRALGKFLEGAGERGTVVAGKGRDLAFGVAPEPGNDGAMAGGQRGERMVAALQPLQRRQRGAEARDQFSGHVELIVGDQPARIAAVQLVAVGAEGGDCAR